MPCKSTRFWLYALMGQPAMHTPQRILLHGQIYYMTSIAWTISTNYVSGSNTDKNYSGEEGKKERMMLS